VGQYNYNQTEACNINMDWYMHMIIDFNGLAWSICALMIQNIWVLIWKICCSYVWNAGFDCCFSYLGNSNQRVLHVNNRMAIFCWTAHSSTWQMLRPIHGGCTFQLHLAGNESFTVPFKMFNCYFQDFENKSINAETLSCLQRLSDFQSRGIARHTAICYWVPLIFDGT
jgi:hypothetical protein